MESGDTRSQIYLEYYLSIVIPVYNEQERIANSLEVLLAYLAKQTYSREIILVDDGSRDNGLGIAGNILEGKEEYRILSYGENRGKGYALKYGITRTQGRYVLFTDADLATPIEELAKFIPYLEPNSEMVTGYPIVHGSRKMPGAIVERHQPWLRENMGKVFTMLCNILVNLNVSDATCGFKAYQGEVAREIYGSQKLSDWSFDAEVIFIARKRGYKIKELPVRWHDQKGTKVRLVRDTFRSLKGLATIRLNDLRGWYKPTLKSEVLKVAENDPVGRMK
jgi:dolichyl-phosphate beta-glucosyltransferase